MADLLADVPDRALAVYAHPADAEVACGGTLGRWAAAGCAVALVVCTRGDKGSHDPAADTTQVAAARADEVVSAAEVLGLVSHEVLGYADGEVDNAAALRGELVERIRAWQPEVVLGHDPTAVFFGGGYVNHRDHREVGFALLDAVSPASASPLYFPDAGKPHRVRALLLSGTLEADCYVDIASAVATKAAALRCHHSQLSGSEEWVDDLVEGRAREAGALAGVGLAEAFRRITLH